MPPINSILFVNPFSYAVSRDLFLRNGSQVFVDSSILYYLAKFRGFFPTHAAFDFSSIGIADYVFKAASINSIEIVVVGGALGENNRFIEIIGGRYCVKMLGIDGFCGNTLDRLTDVLKARSPCIVLLGLGSPTQEIYLDQLSAIYRNHVFFTCGGFITQTSISGGVFYPGYMNFSFGRAIWRFLSQRHVFKRTIKTYPGALLRLIFDYRFLKKVGCDRRQVFQHIDMLFSRLREVD